MVEGALVALNLVTRAFSTGMLFPKNGVEIPLQGAQYDVGDQFLRHRAERGCCAIKSTGLCQLIGGRPAAAEREIGTG